MRLFPRASVYNTTDFVNGFESFTDGSGAPPPINTDPNDGWSLSTGGDWQFWGSDIGASGVTPHTGSKFIKSEGESASEYIYQAIAAGKRFEVVFYFYHNADANHNPNNTIIQIDDGSATDGLAGTDADNLIVLQLAMSTDAAGSYAVSSETYWDLSLKTRFNATGALTNELVKGDSHAESYDFDYNQWIGVKLVISSTGFELWFDPYDTGEFIFYYQGTWTNPNVASMGNLNRFALWPGLEDLEDSREPIIDDVQVDSLSSVSGAEITNLLSAQCTVAEDFAGSAQVVVSDHNMANFSTLKELVRFEGVIEKDDLSRTLGEYTFARQSFSRHKVTFLGVETGRILAKVPAEYNAILAEGEVTAINGEEITDSNAAFTAALIGKFCTFTDTVGPDSETVYPTAASNVYEADRTTLLTPFFETGTYEDLAIAAGAWITYDALNDYCHVLQFTVPDAATADALDITISIDFALRADYSTLPDIYIYNVDTVTWDKISDLDWESGRGPIEFTFDESDFPDNNLSHYFDGTTLKLAIHAGVNDVTMEFLGFLFCSVKSFSSVFTAQDTIFTVDARTGTTLTFTGQNAETAGVDTADRYKVGDTLNTIMTEIWNAAVITWLTLNMEATSKVDAVDWQSSHVLPALLIYKDRMGARLWQSLGYTVNLVTSFVSTGLTLTEEDEVTDAEGKGFDWIPDATNIITKAKVFGAGVFAEGTHSAEYLTRQGLIITDARIASQQSATDLLTQELAKNIGPIETLLFTIDLDMTQARTWDSSLTYDSILLFRTIDLNYNIGGVEKIAVTTGIITKIHYFQSNDSHLRATLTIEVP